MSPLDGCCEGLVVSLHFVRTLPACLPAACCLPARCLLAAACSGGQIRYTLGLQCLPLACCSLDACSLLLDGRWAGMGGHVTPGVTCHPSLDGLKE